MQQLDASPCAVQQAGWSSCKACVPPSVPKGSASSATCDALSSSARTVWPRRATATPSAGIVPPPGAQVPTTTASAAANPSLPPGQPSHHQESIQRTQHAVSLFAQ